MKVQAKLLTMLWVGAQAACTPAEEPPPASPQAPATSKAPVPESPVVATVNGKPITEAEVAMRRRVVGRRKISRAEALQQIIEHELQAQEAEARGLHQTEAFREEMALAKAGLRDARRQILAKSYRLRAVAELPEPPPEEVAAYLRAHSDRIQTEVRLEKITTASREEAQRVVDNLKKEGVWSELAKLHGSGSVGPVGFDGLPDAWWDALDKLKPGEHTKVLESADRFAVLRLVERKEVARPPEDELKRRVRAFLRAENLERQRAGQDAALRKAADIQIPDHPTAPSEPN